VFSFSVQHVMVANAKTRDHSVALASAWMAQSFWQSEKDVGSQVTSNMDVRP